MPLASILPLLKKLVRFGTQFAVDKTSLHKRRLFWGISIGFMISVFVTLLAWLGHFRPYEYFLTDFLQSITQKKAKDVVLLFITESEYENGFHSISPLSRKRLADTFDLLVKLQAKVIALDIDLSDPTEEDANLMEALGRAKDSGIAVVFVGKFKEPSIYPQDGFSDFSPYPGPKSKSTDEGFLIFGEAGPGNQWNGKVMFGGVVFTLDLDGVFRQAEPFYYVERGENAGSRIAYHPIPSFPLAIASAYRGMGQEELIERLSYLPLQKKILLGKEQQKLQEIRIGKNGKMTPNFIGNYRYFEREINLSGLLEEYGPGPSGEDTIFKGKAVILGGTYDKRDFYVTPVGWMSGLEIVANITQSILNNDLITSVNFGKAFILEVVLGTIVAFLFIFFCRLWATLLCLGAMVPMIATASMVSFSNSYYWFDFFPTILGVLIHGWVNRAEADHRTKDGEKGRKVLE